MGYVVDAYYADGVTKKPFYRGYLHEVIFLSSPLWLIPFFLECQSYKEYMSVILFGVANIICYGISSQYHRRKWTAKQEEILYFFDIISIFLMLAFNAAPLFILVIPNESSIAVVIILANIILYSCYVSFFKFNRMITGIYFIVIGTIISSIISPAIYKKCNIIVTICISISAVLNIVGGIIYSIQKPDPYPLLFGYHEIFHLLTFFSTMFVIIINFTIIRDY
jgi:hemolysin III